MAEKIKKVSISQIDKVMKDYGKAETTFEWNGLQIVVKTLLSCKEMIEFAGAVTRSCFAQDTGEYLPEVRDLAIRMQTIEMYSNVRMPDNLEHANEILYRSDLYDEVVKRVNSEQYEQLLTSLDEKISVAADNNADEMRRKVEDAVEKLEKIMELYAGIEKGDLERISAALAENGLPDEGKIMRAYMDAMQEQRRLEASVVQGEPVVKD